MGEKKILSSVRVCVYGFLFFVFVFGLFLFFIYLFIVFSPLSVSWDCQGYYDNVKVDFCTDHLKL